MTPIPDYDQLVRGVLYFPPDLNAKGRAPNDLDRVALRFAGPETWAGWANVDRAELWKLIALQTYLDPEHLPWRHLPNPPFERTVGALFQERLEHACTDLLCMSMRCAQLALDTPLTVVRVYDFLLWAEKECIPCPPAFPGGEIRAKAEARSNDVASRGANATGDWLRVTDLIPQMLPFERATLWRKVKAGIIECVSTKQRLRIEGCGA